MQVIFKSKCVSRQVAPLIKSQNSHFARSLFGLFKGSSNNNKDGGSVPDEVKPVPKAQKYQIKEVKQAPQLKVNKIKPIASTSSRILTDEPNLTIKPYFSNAVSEREKSHTTINLTDLLRQSGEADDTEKALIKKAQELRERKANRGKKLVKRKVEVITQNIRRELPKEL